MIQWLRIWLPMKAARVPSLVRGDPTCLRTAKPTDRSYWSPYALKLMLGSKRSYWKEKPAQLESNPHLPQLEKACVQQWRPSAAKSKKNKKEMIKTASPFGECEYRAQQLLDPHHFLLLCFQESHWTSYTVSPFLESPSPLPGLLLTPLESWLCSVHSHLGPLASALNPTGES